VVTWARLAPVARTASTWRSSISSIASYSSLAQKPIERSPIARMPANTPGPTIVTSISAQISELIERDDTMRNSATGRTSAALGVVLRAAQ
jgi:uncharacterized protein (DUF3084 family)